MEKRGKVLYNTKPLDSFLVPNGDHPYTVQREQKCFHLEKKPI